MHESDRHTALADRRRYALDGTQTDISASEDAGNTRFEQKGITVIRPFPRPHYIVTGQHISECIASNFRW